MATIADLIYKEVKCLPEHLAQEVYDFVRFVEAQHGIKTTQQSASPSPDWKTFFERHTRTVSDASPMNRDEIYVERLR